MRLLGTDAHDLGSTAANPSLTPGTAQLEEREGERGPRGAMLAAHMPASRA